MRAWTTWIFLWNNTERTFEDKRLARRMLPS